MHGRSRYNGGFTILEITVVIVIIALLSTAVLALLSEGRKQSRDKARISEMSQVQLAMKIYSQTNSGYPDCEDGWIIGEGALPGTCIDDVDAALSSYLPEIPEDPLGPGNSDHRTIYDSSYNCPLQGGNVRLLYVTVEKSANANSEVICDSGMSGSYVEIVR